MKPLRAKRFLALMLLGFAAVGVLVVIRRQHKNCFPPVAIPQQTAVSNVLVRSVGVNLGVAATSIPETPPRGAVATVCGSNPDTALQYEIRNNALRSISRIQNLGGGEILSLMEYICSTNLCLRPDREAALRNDVLNLLRAQNPPPDGLAEMLAEMVESGAYPPAVTDYCIQHLGAMLNGISDFALRSRIRGVFVASACQTRLPCAGTALYALDGDRRATGDEKAELKRLTLVLCRPFAHPASRVAAIQLAGQRGYAEALPILREILADPNRDAVAAIAAAGSVGLLGGAGDIPLLESMATKGGRFRPAADTAAKRIRERMSD